MSGRVILSLAAASLVLAATPAMAYDQMDLAYASGYTVAAGQAYSRDVQVQEYGADYAGRPIDYAPGDGPTDFHPQSSAYEAHYDEGYVPAAVYQQRFEPHDQDAAFRRVSQRQSYGHGQSYGHSQGYGQGYGQSYGYGQSHGYSYADVQGHRYGAGYGYGAQTPCAPMGEWVVHCVYRPIREEIRVDTGIFDGGVGVIPSGGGGGGGFVIVRGGMASAGARAYASASASASASVSVRGGYRGSGGCHGCGGHKGGYGGKGH